MKQMTDALPRAPATGPDVWSGTGGDVQTMAFGSEQSLLWADAGFGGKARSRTDFLRCEAR